MKKFLLLIFIIIIGIIIATFYLGREEQSSTPATIYGEPSRTIMETLDTKKEDLQVRQPAVAGMFYPGDEKTLKAKINGFLEKVDTAEFEGNLKMVIAPHAGYEYSGGVAAYSFKAVQEAKNNGQNFKTVILIGPSHHHWFEGVSIFPKGYYQTPLGKVKVNQELAEKIIKEDKRFHYEESAHIKEHCLEVEIPFLQSILGDFEIVPIITGETSNDTLESLAKTLVKYIDEDSLVVISTDFSHYPPADIAREIDNKTIQAILSGEVENLERTITSSMAERHSNLGTCLCGEDAVKVGLFLAKEKGWGKIKLLKYTNSGEITGDSSQAVGYTAISFSAESERNQISTGLLKSDFNTPFSSEDRKTLLEIARQSLEIYLKERKIPEFNIASGILQEKRGAFVTLKKDGQLRGCIGVFEPDIPLYKVITQMAIAAGTQDTRFYPVGLAELENLEYEISALSPLEKIDSWEKIEIGKHGVQVRKDFHSGVFLPQVATENNWGLEEFMNNLCAHKAGLPINCWKTGDADLYIFTAEVFGEE